MKGVAPIQLALIQMAAMNVDVKKATNSQDQRKIMKRGISSLESGIQNFRDGKFDRTDGCAKNK